MSRIDTHCSLESYFEGLLRDALDAEQVAVPDDTFTYVLHLVGDFSSPDALRAPEGRDEPGTPGLVWLYQAAREAAPSHRFDAYRRLGDVALVVAGFFGPHVERSRSLVSLDYYVEMGRSAYSAAAALGARTGFEHLLADLSRRFGSMVEVLTRVAEQTTLPVTADLGALYQRLLRNPDSPELSRRLLGQGAFPVFGTPGVAA